jgi:hypothetical protein
MGGWSNRIGKYEVSQMDYYYENIKDENMPLDYYEKQAVQIKFKDLKTDKEKMIDVPLIELHDFIKYNDSDLYFLSSDNEDKSLMNWLWRKLKDSGTKIVCGFKLNVHTSNRNCPSYWLNSKPMDENIVITTNPMEFEISDIKELFWIGERGFYYA